MALERGWQFLNFMEKIVVIWRRIQGNQHLKNIFNHTAKSKKPAAKFCAFGQKMKKNLKNYKKI